MAASIQFIQYIETCKNKITDPTKVIKIKIFRLSTKCNSVINGLELYM